MKIKRLINWLRRDTRKQSIASEAAQSDIRVTPEQHTEDEYCPDFSFNWEAIDQIESSGLGKNTLDQCDCEATVSYPTHKLVVATSSDVEEDIGVDSYNAGRFYTENK